MTASPAPAALRAPLHLLACPVCVGALERACASASSTSAPVEDHLRCQACDALYPVRGGVPALMTPGDRARFQARLQASEGAIMAARYEERAGSRLAARLKRALRPPLPLVHNPAEPRLACPPPGAGLWLGGGGRPTPGFINLDIAPFPSVDLVANAERLPFREAVLDAIECDAVLEHVEKPELLAREMLRVLKPGGQVHAVAPFCHPYHAYPADFRRWTRPGLEQWFQSFGFECLESGVRTGATATLLAFTLEYAKVVLGEGALGKAAYAACGWVLFPLRYLDNFLNRNRRAHLLANHVYVLARKPA